MGDEGQRKKVDASKVKELTQSESSDIDSNGSSNSLPVVEKLHGRIRDLEGLLGGKEEALQVALQGLESATEVEKGYHTQLEGFRTRVGEFQEAVKQRDQVIQQLSVSLEQTLRDRDELAQDGERLVQEVSLLRSQLQATSHLVAQGSSKTHQDVMLLQNKMLGLEDTIKKKDVQIDDLQKHMLDQEILKKELEHKKAELAQYKAEAASHVQQLMREVERLHQDAAARAAFDSQWEQQLTALEAKHQEQMAAQHSELEEHFGQQLVQIQEKHRLQFSEQLETLNKHHAEEMANASLSLSDASEGSLKTQKQLQELTERALLVASEREDLLTQIALYKNQVQTLSLELSKFSATAEEEKQSLNVSLESENISLKEQLKSLSNLLRTTQAEKEQELKVAKESRALEIATWSKKVESLNAELQQMAKSAQEHLLRVEACNKNHETELNTLKQSHAQEIKHLVEQLEGVGKLKIFADSLQGKLREKTEMEKRLQNELQMSVRREEELKGLLMKTQMEVQQLNTALESHQELSQQQASFTERLKTELSELQKNEAVLQAELKVLKNNVVEAKDSADVLLYKEQVDKLNEQLCQKVKLEDALKTQVLEKEQLEQALRKGLEEQTAMYKLELDGLNKKLHEKAKIEEQLKNELRESMLSGEKLQTELVTLKSALEELKNSTEEVEVYKNQVEVLNSQLQERSQSEHKIISDYESRVAILTSELHAIENRLSSEIQGIQTRAREELAGKQEAEKRLEGELEAVRSELTALKASTQVQMYKEQINELNLLVQEKQKAESTLKAELAAVSAEVVSLKENQQQLESFNSDLVERLHTEHRLQEELIAAAKMHKEQVDVLSSKISELTSQQNSLDNEAISMRQQMEAQKDYIHNLEMMKEQVSQSSKTKEALINDLSLCVKSLTEDNSSYQQKLEALNKRLDDECHRADENMAVRETYQKEIGVHKKQIEELMKKLQDTLYAKEELEKQISVYQKEAESYKGQLASLNNSFSMKESELCVESADGFSEKVTEEEATVKDVPCGGIELLKYKETVEVLNAALSHKEKIEKEHKTQIQSYSLEVENLKKQLFEVTEMKREQDEEFASCMKQFKEIHSKLKAIEEEKLHNEGTYKRDLQCLEDNIRTKNEIINRLNVELEEAACKFDDLKNLFEDAQQRFSEEREINTKLIWEKDDVEAKYKAKLGKLSETHQLEMEECIRNMSALQSGLQELTLTHDKCSKDRDSLNFSSISETELLQLESKLQHALNERNEIEKSFKDHINKLAEKHLKEMSLYEEQLRAANEKLDDITKAHKNCNPMKEAFKTRITTLTDDHQKEMELLQRKLEEANREYDDIFISHQSCSVEKEAIINSNAKVIEKYKQEIVKYIETIGQTSETLEELSKHHLHCVSLKGVTGTKEEQLSVKEYASVVNEAFEQQADVNSNSVEEQSKSKIEETFREYQKKIDLYKQQLKEAIDKLEKLSNSHKKCVEEKVSFKESIQKLSENCQKEVKRYTEQLVETNKKIELVSKELACAMTENNSLKTHITELSSKSQEITLYEEELNLAKLKIEELSKLYMHCCSEKAALAETISEKDSSLAEKDNKLQTVVSDLVNCQRELSQTREYMDLLKVKLQDEISKIHVELQNLVNICTPCTEPISDKVKVDARNTDSDYSHSNSDGILSPDGWSQRDGNQRLEDSFVCAATIHHDVSSLRSQVECLLSDLNSARQKSVIIEEKLAAKEHYENILLQQIEVLKVEVKKSNDLNESLRLHVEELTVKFLATESLLAGKVEAECSLQKEISEMELKECNKCKHLMEEIARLTSDFKALEEKHKNVKVEYSSLFQKSCELQEKYEKTCTEKTDLEELFENLKQQQIVTSNLMMQQEHGISEKVHNDLVQKYSTLEENHHKVLAEKQKIEEILDEMKAEVLQFHELQNETACQAFSLNSSKMRNSVEKGAQEQMENVKESPFVQGESDTGDLSAVDFSTESFPGIQVVGADGSVPVGAVGNTNRSSLHTFILKLMQQCGALNMVKKALLSECEALRSRLEEREAQELLFNEELASANSRCEALEQRLQEARARESSREALAGAKLALEYEVRALEGRNTALKVVQTGLEEELRIAREEAASSVASVDCVTFGGCETLAGTSLVAAALRRAECECHALQKRVESLEAAKRDMLSQFAVFLKEARRTREQLEDAWQERAEAEEQLGRARCELALAGLRRSGVRDSLPTLPVSDADSPVFNVHHEVHLMVEEMAQELVTLRRALQAERTRNECLLLEVRPSHEHLEVQQKLELVLKSNTELLKEKQALLEKLEEVEKHPEMKDQIKTDLVTQLSVYREQHASLAEAVGAAGVLQETVRQQKEELLSKLKEKEAVEELLTTERAELKCSQLKVQLMQQQLTEKNNLYQEVFHQKASLEKELEQLEKKLCEREQLLHLQRAQLQAEIRAQDMRLRRWQLQHRSAEVEKRLDDSLRQQPSDPVAISTDGEVPPSEVQSQLEVLRLEMQEAHSEALARLRHHLDSEFALREQALRAGFSAELSSTQASHREQLASLEKDLLAAEKELEILRNTEIMRTLGSTSNEIGELAEFKKKYEQELESICIGLDEGQAHLFAVLKHLFEEFARQLVTGTTVVHQKQQEQRIKREIAALESKHQLELKQLQTQISKEHVKTLEDLKQQLIYQKEEPDKKMDSLRAMCPIVNLHSADSSQVALVQLKHLLYSEYTTTLKEVTKDWSDQWKADIRAQMEALESALAEEAIALQRLRDSPDSHSQILKENKDTETLEEKFSTVEKLISKAEDLLEKQIRLVEKALSTVGARLNAAFAPVAEHARAVTAAAAGSRTAATSKAAAGPVETRTAASEPDEASAKAGTSPSYEQQGAAKSEASAGVESSAVVERRGAEVEEAEEERDAYRRLAQVLAAEHAAEAGRLREALASLEARRTAEMEELRRYFEQKVQELEKHYSEEITSQHSRRISSSSCDSDSEFTTDALLGAGDHALPRIPPLTHICDSCAADPGYKELEERWRTEVEKRVEESRAQLCTAKKEIEARYELELSSLREQYEEKLSRLANDLSSTQQSAVQYARARAGKHLQTLWRREIRAIRTHMLSGEVILTNLVKGAVEEKNKAPLLEVEVDGEVPEGLEDLCLELSSQLRQLEATWRQDVLKQRELCLKEREAAEADELALERVSVLSVQEALTKVQVEEKLRREIREELEKELEEQVEKVAEMMKNNAEMEQKIFIENQSQMMKEFLEQHRKDLETLKQQHQMELTNGSSIRIPQDVANVRKQLSDCQNGSTQTEQLPKKLDQAVSPKHFIKKDKGIQTDEPAVLNVSTASRLVQTSPVKTSSMSLDVTPECLRTHPFDVNSLSLLSEAPSFPEPDLDGEDEQGGSFRKALIDAQTEYAKNIQAMLLEWMKILRKAQAGKTLEEREAQFLTEEYISECCSKFKALLCSLESMYLSDISRLQEVLQRQIPISRSPSIGQDQVNEDRSSSQNFSEIINERDRWRQVGLVLKKLVEELLSYLEECEDEVNQTLLSEPAEAVEESQEIPTLLDPSSSPVPTPVPPSLPATPVHKRGKRVRFAPTCLDFKMMFSDEQMLLDSIREDKDLSGKLRAELDMCLEHLRSEAAALVEGSPLRWTPLHKGCTMKREDILAADLAAAHQRLAELEAEQRTVQVSPEEVAEGFGEQQSPARGPPVGQRLHSLAQLQDKARSILAGGRPSSPQEAQQLQLLDEICREGDRLAEEARREREDLRMQVESADKRLRDTRRFLEEQAAEREQERDEFQQELAGLQEQLKARERDLADQQRLSREVEALEQQSKEAMARHQQLEADREALQAELKAAVDKVWLLRDVVAELELQAEAKEARAAHLESRIQELELALEEQEHSRQQLSEELESIRTEGGAEMSRQVAALEEQLQTHRLQVEQCKPAALKQMKTLIRELEVNIDKRTHQLEALHAISSNQSSPTEDISVRDIFQCESPDDLRAAISPSLQGSPVSPLSPPPTPLPLRELTRLQERLQRHARAEEAALKRSRDLEMQLKALRKAEEEACAERDMLQERVSNQLLRIASLEASVDAGRWKGTTEEKGEEEEEEEEAKEMQMLQRRAQDAEEETERLATELLSAQKEVQQLKEVITHLEASAAERERSLVTRLSCAEEAEVAFRERYETLQHEIDDLHKNISPSSGNRLIPLPALFDALLADKNTEIDTLRRRLRDLEVPPCAVVSPRRRSDDSRDFEEMVRVEQQRADALQERLLALEEQRSRADSNLLQMANARSCAEQARSETLQRRVDALQEHVSALEEEVSRRTMQEQEKAINRRDKWTQSTQVLQTEAKNRKDASTLTELSCGPVPVKDTSTSPELLPDISLSPVAMWVRPQTPSQTPPNGLDELAGQVERELEEAAHLDTSLLSCIVEAGAQECTNSQEHRATCQDDEIISQIEQEVIEMVDGWSQFTRQSMVVTEKNVQDDAGDPREEDATLINQLEDSLNRMREKTKLHVERELEMQRTVDAERERADNLQRALRLEQQQALDLQSQLASLEVRAGLASEASRLKLSSLEVEQERAKTHALEQQLKVESTKYLQLKNTLLSERQHFHTALRRDAELLQAMRQRLHEANQVKKHNNVSVQYSPQDPIPSTSRTRPTSLPRNQTEDELFRTQAQHLKLKCAPQVEGSKQSEGRASGMAGDAKDPFWVPAEIHAELQRRLKATEDEMNVLRRRYNKEREGGQQLRAEVSLLKGHNNALDDKLSEVRTSLALCQTENDRLAHLLRALEEADLRQKNWASSELSLVQEKSRQLEANVVRLEAELAAEQAVREDAVTENLRLRGEVEALKMQLEEAITAHDHDSRQSTSGPDSLSLRLKEGNISVDQQMRDHSKVAITLGRLVEERIKLQQKINTLEGQFSSLKVKETAAQNTIIRLSSEKSSATEECIKLRLELARMKERQAQKTSEVIDYEELEERANRTYGRYLRAESYRKALVWQKKYLLIALGGYRRLEAKTLSQLASVVTRDNLTTCRNGTKQRRVHFSSVVLAIVAIQRMKFLVRRWSNPGHVGRNEILRQNYAVSHSSERQPVHGLRSGAGGIFATSSTWSIPASASRVVLHSPPSQDRGTSWTRTGPLSLPQWRSMDVLPGSLAPHRLSQFVERCDVIQQRLSMASLPVVPFSSSKSPQRDDS